MGRPEYSSKPGTTSRGGLSAWIQNRKDRKKALAETTAKMITDDTAKNELAIVNTLSSIDFIHSRLPKEVLELKSDPNRPCGDLEYAVKSISKTLLKNPQTLAVDLRKVDEKLLTIAVLLKQAVEQGDKRAAYAAKGALVRGINDIRYRIPANNPEMFKLFVETNEKYLESWITLIGISQVADRLEENVNNKKELLAKKKEKNEETVNTIKKWTQEKNSPEGEALLHIANHDSPEERDNWNPMQRDVHKFLVEFRLDEVRMKLDEKLLEQSELDYLSKANQADILKSKVASQAIVCDPNLMNKFREDVDKMFEDLAASDAELDETLRLMDDIEGRVKQFETAPGAIRAREVATEQARVALEEISKQQHAEAGNRAKYMADQRKKYNILTEEEEKLFKLNAEKELQKAEQEMLNAIAEAEEIYQSEGELNYN